MLLFYDFTVLNYFDFNLFFSAKKESSGLFFFIFTYLFSFFSLNSLFLFYSFLFYSFFLTLSSNLNFYEIRVNGVRYSDRCFFIDFFNPFCLPVGSYGLREESV